MAEPKRIQRKRSKGWRMPEGAVYVGRPTKWGNPFKVGDRVLVRGSTSGPDGAEWEVLTATRAVDLYRQHVRARRELAAAVRSELPGCDLACWCSPGAPCHADVLLELANG